MKEILKDKKKLMELIVLLIVIIIIVVGVIIFLNRDETSKLDDEKIVKEQKEVTDLVSSYVTEEVKEYAIANSKIEFTIKELRGIFNTDTSKFNELKYGCSEDGTFIKYNNEYSDYSVMLDCKDFYLN